MHSVDIEIQDHGIRFGDGTTNQGTGAVGEVLTYDILNLKDFFVLNRDAGNDAIIIISGYIVNGGRSVLLGGGVY